MNNFEPLKPSIVLGVAAHPDDLDFGTAGTMAKFAKAGADIYYLLLTDCINSSLPGRSMITMVNETTVN